MSFSAITTTVGNVYTPTKVNNQTMIRTDLTNSTGQVSRTLEVSHTPGTPGKPGRHMVKLSAAELDANGNPVPYGIHVVLTVPVKGITVENVTDMAAEMVAILTAPNVEELVKNSLL